MASEWQLDKEAAEQEHLEKYGFLSDDLGDEWELDSAPGLEVDGSWAMVGGVWKNLGDNEYSWDYPDPLSRGTL